MARQVKWKTYFAKERRKGKTAAEIGLEWRSIKARSVSVPRKASSSKPTKSKGAKTVRRRRPAKYKVTHDTGYAPIPESQIAYHHNTATGQSYIPNDPYKGLSHPNPSTWLYNPPPNVPIQFNTQPTPYTAIGQNGIQPQQAVVIPGDKKRLAGVETIPIPGLGPGMTKGLGYGALVRETNTIRPLEFKTVNRRRLKID